MTKPPFYITTAISYVNGVPHLGHAYECILTDVMARFQRLDGRETFFLTGTDEHGEKVAKTAEENGMSAKDFADKNAASFIKMTKTLGISNDDFIRTSQERHHKSVQDIWKKLQDKGDIYLGKYEGWYSIREEAYFAEDELRESEDGTKFTPHGTPVEWVEEPSYFFRLSEYTKKLLKHYETHPEFIAPDARRNEIISFVKQEGGLRDLSISRHKSRLKWGIPVPGDEDHVMYVWLDALTNYITGIGYPDTESESYRKFWPAQFHVIGKDIIRFHCIYWPAFLMSADIALPETVFAHGFINVQGEKMSKSVGNVLSPDGLVETYGLDQIRYFLMREIPHGQDGNFSHEHAIARINADLANGLGNLAQRTLSMIHKNCDGAYPVPGEFTDDDKALLDKAYKTMLDEVRENFNTFQIHRALEAIWRIVSDANAYIDEQAPWTLKKEDPARMNTVLYVLADVIRCLAIAVQPVVPTSAAKMLDQLKIPAEQRTFEHISADFTLKPGITIDKPEGIFPRIVEEEAA
ncbi:MAG: methionine--tRNA ligase [Rhodospirillales bacterium]|nr:methionine--tRNA ligase [Alphaproteobacteria bacterium]MCB9980927.1 methionine--tRNA ligase [Rhodospirillales bacterium]